MPTSKQEALFHLTKTINQALTVNENDLSLKIGFSETLAKFTIELGHIVTNDTPDRVLARLRNSSEFYFDQVANKLKALGYKAKFHPIQMEDIQEQLDNYKIGEPTYICAYPWSFCMRRVDFTTLAAKIRKELGEIKRAPNFVSGLVIHDARSNKKAPVNLTGKSCDDYAQQIVDKALQLNYNRMLNDWDIVGGYNYEYLYSKLPAKRIINLITQFEVNFTWYGDIFRLNLDFTGNLPKVKITQQDADVTSKFFQSPYLPAYLFGMCDYKIKAHIRAHFGRAAQFSEFKIKSEKIRVAPSNHQKFKNVTFVLRDAEHPMFVRINQEGVQVQDGITGEEVTDKQEHLKEAFISSPELISEMRSANRSWYTHIMMQKLNIKPQNLGAIYFH